MKKKGLIVLSLLALISLLVGCRPYISITGQIVDQHQHPVRGVLVTGGGSESETNAAGSFSLSVPDVEAPQDITITIDGSKIGFPTVTKTLQLYTGQNCPAGMIQLTRQAASVDGTIAIPLDALSVATTQSSTPVKLPTLKKGTYAPGEVVVKFKNTMQPQSVELLSEKMHIQVLSTLPTSKGKIVTVKTTDDIEKTIATLKQRSDVEYAEPNYYVYPLSVAQPQGAKLQNYYNDPYYADQWNLQAINAENAWKNEFLGSSQVTVAVLDTGIKKGLSDLDSNILWDLGKDFVDEDDDPSDSWGSHGTNVASIIGAIPDNGMGIAGINHSVGIVPIRILHSADNDGASAWGTVDKLLAGLEYAIYDARVDIINLSVAIDISGSNVQSVSEMLDNAEKEGVLVIAAAGNEKQATPDFPASYPTVLSVGAVGPTLQPASYTNHGVDIYAPGGDYYLYPVSASNCIRALGTNGAEWVQGTSIASAHVAGVAALILAEHPEFTPAGLRSRLKYTALDFAYAQSQGFVGLVDAMRAVTNIAHARIFVFFGEESFNQFSYDTEESTYSYAQDEQNYFRLASVNTGYRTIYAWVDADGDGKLSDNDLFAEQSLNIAKGDEVHLNLQMSRY